MLRAIDGIGAVSLTDWWPVRGALLAVTVLVMLLMLRHARRISSILLATALFAGLVMANLLLAGNAYYERYPTVGAVLSNSPRLGQKLPAGVPPTGQSLPVDIPGARSGFAVRPAIVHLPRAWFAEPRPTLPVVVLLHGSPGEPAEWIDPGAAGRIADAWADRNGGVAPILVIPDVVGRTGLGVCADGPSGNVETYLTADLPAFVQREFSTRPPGRGWGVAGHSAGGGCALMLTLRHPDVFGTFADFGGLSGGADPDHDPAALLGARAFPGVAGWFETGDADPAALAAATALIPLAETAGIDTCLVVRPGVGPGAPTWSLAFTDALPWLAGRVGQVPQTPQMTSLCSPLPA